MSERDRTQPDLARRAGRAWRRLTSGGRPAPRKTSAPPPRRRSFLRRIIDDIFWLVVGVICIWVIVNVIAHLQH